MSLPAIWLAKSTVQRQAMHNTTPLTMTAMGPFSYVYGPIALLCIFSQSYLIISINLTPSGSQQSRQLAVMGQDRQGWQKDTHNTDGGKIRTTRFPVLSLSVVRPQSCHDEIVMT